jgi:hypothetical protein
MIEKCEAKMLRIFHGCAIGLGVCSSDAALLYQTGKEQLKK